MNKLVSIIIPTYNYAGYVRDAVESALAQTYIPIEIIVLDDGSTDNTKAVLSDYMDTGRINYIYQNNKGLAAARNAGLRASKGDYICLLDSDDLIHENKIEVQVRYLENNPDYGVAFSDFRFFRDRDISNLIAPSFSYSGELTFRELTGGKFIPVHTTLVRRTVFEKVGIFDETLRECEDSDFWIRALIAGVRFLHVNQVMAYYRLHGGQMVNEPVKIGKTFIKVINRYKEYDRDGAALGLCYWGQYVGRQLVYGNQMKEGRKYLRNYIGSRKDKVIRIFFIILMSYLFSGETIKKLAESQGNVTS